MLARRVEEEQYGYVYEEQPAQPVRQKRLVQKAYLNTHLRAKCLLLVGLLAVMIMAVAIRSSIIAGQGYELVQIQQQAERLEQTNEQLKIENARLKSPQRVQAIAQEKLGMSVPTQVYFASEKP